MNKSNKALIWTIVFLSVILVFVMVVFALTVSGVITRDTFRI